MDGFDIKVAVGDSDFNWAEAERLAALPDFGVLAELRRNGQRSRRMASPASRVALPHDRRHVANWPSFKVLSKEKSERKKQ